MGEQMLDIVSELHALASDYALGVDNRDVEQFAGTFLPDATLRVHNPNDSPEPNAEYHGHAEIRQVIARIARYSKTFHFVGNTSHSIESDRAAGEVYCIAHHLETTSTGGTDLVMFIRYSDQYRPNTDGRWKIADRTVRVYWTETHVTNRVAS
jgi:ketosteroid isomerase-like protein